MFLPLLSQLGFDRLVDDAGYPGSKMVPAARALLSLLILKLLDKERRSHINDFNFDEALGLFAGLNILPKKSFVTDYSYRTQRVHQEKLLTAWIGKLAPLLFPQPEAFNLDFHAIPFRGDAAGLDNHYLPLRGKAGPSVLTFFAQEQKSRVLCYANANLTRDDQAGEVLRFVAFWHQITGRDPQWLYFDSKLTNYAELSRLNLHKDIRYIDETVAVDGYDGLLRQIAVDGLGRERYTLFLSNNNDVTARDLVLRYTCRNGVEDSLGISVNFFHLDCLASEVRLNVDLDVALTVIANGCYRWLAEKLHGFTKAKPKELYRKFIETGGRIEIKPNRLVIYFDRRAHNPILREAKLDQDSPPIPWLGHRRITYEYS